MPFEVFTSLRDELPTFADIADKGGWGAMRAIDPPITVPAWMSMFTGLDPGQLGVYGFRNKVRGRYSEYIVFGNDVRVEYPWEKMKLRSIVIGLPPGYPARSYEKGIWISDFRTPKGASDWIYPPDLAGEIGDYVFDIEYRTESKEQAWRDLVKMTERRWEVANMLAKQYNWDVFVLHEIGSDRAHHLFQACFDPSHPRFEQLKSSDCADYIPNYYRLLDSLSSKLISTVKNKYNDFNIIILSDHGNQAQKGVFAVNEWLIEEGLLEVRRSKNFEDIESADVNWARTKAWAWGGYYSRIFINLKDREQQGIVGSEEYYDLIRELKRKLRTLKTPWGYARCDVHEPKTLYRQTLGNPPDLMLYVDDLKIRIAQTLPGQMWLEANDRGPDDSTHSFNGVIISTLLDGRRDVYALDVAGLLTSSLSFH
ncbi:MAG: alkaline phosphatase family protein [Thermoproteus sp.]|nr:alkaline phosphatase family protein [Thermoproteus sp.]